MTSDDAVAKAIDRHEVHIEIGVQQRLSRFVDLLCRHGARTNLVGTTDPFRVADEMVVDSLRLTSIADPPGSLVDIGSGAGLPGIPLAIAWPDTAVTLVEPREKRILFLRTVVRRLELDNVDVQRARIEDLDHSRRFEMAVSKAVFAPDRWLTEARPLVSAGGTVAVYANGDADEAAHLFPETAEIRANATYSLDDDRLRTIFVVSL